MSGGDGREPDDDTLVRRSQDGDDHAFAELVRRHADLAYRVALRMLRDPHAADDAAQEAFVRAWRSLDGFRSDARFTSWLYRIVVTSCIDHARRRTAARLPPDVEVTDPSPSPHDEAAARETADQVLVVVEQLAPGDRAAFVLRTVEGLSYSEVAEILGISVAAVRSRLRRARRQVLARLDQEERP